MESPRDSLWPSSQMLSRALGFFKVGLNQSLLENVLNLESQLDLLRVQLIEDIAEALTVEISRHPGAPAVFSLLCDDNLLSAQSGLSDWEHVVRVYLRGGNKSQARA